jgi:hypothetical protein
MPAFAGMTDGGRLCHSNCSNRSAPNLGGEPPNYADYIVFGGFQWARAVSLFKLLEAGDPIYAWREKLLDAFDGLARSSQGYPV